MSQVAIPRTAPTVRSQDPINLDNTGLLDLIEVTAPYYAFRNLSIDGMKQVHGLLQAEQPMGQELGYMSGAEAGRHLAILGSCALASSNPKKEKHFYVAHTAQYRSHYDPIDLSERKPTAIRQVIAQTISIDKRQGKAYAQLNNVQGRMVADLTTEYHVIKAASFMRLYAAFACDYDKPKTSPYTQEIDLDDVRVKDNALSARFGPVIPQQCSGHFDKLPCLPVAILMYILSQGVSYLINHKNGDVKDMIMLSADVSASKFAFAGESVQIKVQMLEEIGQRYKLNCQALDENGEEYGSMITEFKAF